MGAIAGAMLQLTCSLKVSRLKAGPLVASLLGGLGWMLGWLLGMDVVGVAVGGLWGLVWL